MTLKKLRSLIIILIILTIVVIISSIIITKNNKKKMLMEEVGITSPYEDEEPEKVNYMLQDMNIYKKLRSQISTMLLYKNGGNGEAVEEITGAKNSFDNVIIDVSNPLILDVVYRSGDNMNSINFIKFKYYKQNQNYYAIVFLDNYNNTYKILPSTEEDYIKASKNILDDKYNKKYTIETKEYNVIINPQQLTEQEIVKEYFDNFIQKERYYPEEAYNNIDIDYRDNRFKTYESYLEYISENSGKIEALDVNSRKKFKDFSSQEEFQQYMQQSTKKGLSKYSIKKYNNYTQYVCIDDYGDTYIFNVTGAMNYSVYLDDYRIDLPDFIEKYSNSSDKEKVVLNIDRYLRAIESGDYQYAYSKLSEDFKNNNFKTLDSFKTYMLNNKVEYDKISVANVEEKNGVFICKLTIKRARSRQFIVKLNEGTDFVMSFSI